MWLGLYMWRLSMDIAFVGTLCFGASEQGGVICVSRVAENTASKYGFFFSRRLWSLAIIPYHK